jgi:hypothetical protein
VKARRKWRILRGHQLGLAQLANDVRMGSDVIIGA